MDVTIGLIVPDSYIRATPEVVRIVVNGCGPGGWKYDLVPDTILGLCITETCNIHDWMYNEGSCETDKIQADITFLRNTIELIDQAARKSIVGKVLKPHRCQRAFEYYLAVHEFGNDAFWAGKEKLKEAA